MTRPVRGKFVVGDMVRVKTLDELVHEFGDNIDTPCSFVDEMLKFCDKVMEIASVFAVDGGSDIAYTLVNGDGWYFDECVLDEFAEEDENQLDLNAMSISYENLF